MKVKKSNRYYWIAFITIVLSGGFVLLFLSAENDTACKTAITFFKQNQSVIKNKSYLAVIDYTKPSFIKRLFIYNMHNGTVTKYLVAHGKDSGYIVAHDFSNEIDSHKSCKGFLITGETFNGDHGLSLRLHGLQDGVNNNAFTRDIVIHGADYVSWKSIIFNAGRLGRSWGCPVVAEEKTEDVIGKLKDGALVYIHAN